MTVMRCARSATMHCPLPVITADRYHMLRDLFSKIAFSLVRLAPSLPCRRLSRFQPVSATQPYTWTNFGIPSLFSEYEGKLIMQICF